MYKIYPGSHNIGTEEELQASGIHAREDRVRSHQVLVASGGLWFEMVGSGGGVVMWEGFLEEPVGLYLDECTPYFILSAYGGA